MGIIRRKFLPKPNFFIPGAPKCGTTSLAHWLGEHPNVFVPAVKEPRFFSTDLFQTVKDEAEYWQLFDRAASEQHCVGEASTLYLYSKEAVPKIEAALEKPKYIVMVRNPVDIAYSLHEQKLYVRSETVKDFKTAWDLSPYRRRGEKLARKNNVPAWMDYQSICMLGEQLKRLYEIVDADRILVLVLDDMRTAPQQEYLKALEFLNLPDDGRKSFPVYNASKEWRFPILPKVLLRSARRIQTYHSDSPFYKPILKMLLKLRGKMTDHRKRPPLSAELRQEITSFYQEDIALLSSIIGRDLGHLWNTQTS